MDVDERLGKSIRSLVVAVWCLCAVLAGFLGLTLWSWLRTYEAVQTTYSSSSGSSSDTDPAAMQMDIDNDFSARPVGEKIRRASVILLVELQEVGGRHKAIITEIVKQRPGTRLYYKVGDEYESLSHMPTQKRGGCDEPDSVVFLTGNVVFLTGNPARMRESHSFEGDRLIGLGDLPIAELRRLAQESLRQ